jgi:hypothetical protein
LSASVFEASSVRLRLTHNVMAWCIGLLLALLLVLQSGSQPLSIGDAPAIRSRLASDIIVRPQHAAAFARAIHRERSSGGNASGRDFLGVTIFSQLDRDDRHAIVRGLGAITALRDFLSCRTAHPRAPPA